MLARARGRRETVRARKTEPPRSGKWTSSPSSPPVSVPRTDDTRRPIEAIRRPPEYSRPRDLETLTFTANHLREQGSAPPLAGPCHSRKRRGRREPSPGAWSLRHISRGRSVGDGVGQRWLLLVGSGGPPRSVAAVTQMCPQKRGRMKVGTSRRPAVFVAARRLRRFHSRTGATHKGRDCVKLKRFSQAPEEEPGTT